MYKHNKWQNKRKNELLIVDIYKINSLTTQNEYLFRELQTEIIIKKNFKQFEILTESKKSNDTNDQKKINGVSTTS